MLSNHRYRTRFIFPFAAALAIVVSALSVTVVSAGSAGGPHGYQGPRESPRPGVSADVTCSGYGCDSTDPVATGCSATDYTASSAPIKYDGVSIGEVDNRYSTACKTNWSRVIGYTDEGYSTNNKFADVCRYPGSDGYCATYYEGTAQTIYSDQVYAPSPICATAYGLIFIGGNSPEATAEAC
jgi:hypothetical protein